MALHPHTSSLEQRRSKEIVDLLVLGVQRKTERAYAVVRIMFALAILVHFLRYNDAVDPGARERSLIEVPALLAATLGSLPILWLTARERFSRWILDASAVLDVLTTIGTLLAGVLIPWPTYTGLLQLHDLAILPVLCVAAGLRMSVRATLIGACATALGFFGLVALDVARNAARITYRVHETDLYATYLVGATVLGALLARRARSLAEAAARQALRAEAARDGLTWALQDRHDFGSLLTSARMNVDMLKRALAQPGGDAAVELAGALQSALDDLANTLAASRDRTYAELAASAAVERVSPFEIMTVLRDALAVRFPQVQFALNASPSSAPDVSIVGGSRGLERVLLNLLVNAAEGDGTRGARRVEISIVRRGAWVQLSVEDDGPGLPKSLIERRAERFGSTKSHGAGLGLVLVEGVVQASGGHLLLENLLSGARVTLMLQAAGALEA